jgi:hypothetical protein
LQNPHIEEETFFLFCLFFQPSTEKVHQIIARTAMFVSEHGGQSEIVLRVKQGDNPAFGFLMPNHHLHAYFRFLVDHQELLKPDSGGKSLLEKDNAESGLNQTGGALSILGSVYGSAEDEDGATEDIHESKRNESEEAVGVGNATVSHGSEQAESPVNVTGKGEVVAKGSDSILKEKAPVIKRNRFISTVGTISGIKKEGDALSALSTAGDKSQASLLSMSKVEPPIVEPSSDLKRVVDKIVEFILRNGKDFEAVLVEQDKKHGRFPFLLSSNRYHPYYLKVLKEAQEVCSFVPCAVLIVGCLHEIFVDKINDIHLQVEKGRIWCTHYLVQVLVDKYVIFYIWCQNLVSFRSINKSCAYVAFLCSSMCITHIMCILFDKWVNMSNLYG